MRVLAEPAWGVWWVAFPGPDARGARSPAVCTWGRSMPNTAKAADVGSSSKRSTCTVPSLNRLQVYQWTRILYELLTVYSCVVVTKLKDKHTPICNSNIISDLLQLVDRSRVRKLTSTPVQIIFGNLNYEWITWMPAIVPATRIASLCTDVKLAGTVITACIATSVM